MFWDLDTRDWESKNADAVYDMVMNHVTGGNIILMHDIHSSTVDACERLIPDLQAQGYQLVAIDELAASRGYDLEAGVTYFGFTDEDIAADSVTDKDRAET